MTDRGAPLPPPGRPATRAKNGTGNSSRTVASRMMAGGAAVGPGAGVPAVAAPLLGAPAVAVPPPPPAVTPLPPPAIGSAAAPSPPPMAAVVPETVESIWHDVCAGLRVQIGVVAVLALLVAFAGWFLGGSRAATWGGERSGATSAASGADAGSSPAASRPSWAATGDRSSSSPSARAS